MKCVLVTGGAGFLGSHLCDRLIESGNYVICLDNFFTGSKENIQHLVGNPNFELEERDIIWPYMKGVDEIYNLACPASPVHYQYDPIKTINTSVYGDPVKHPQTEEYWGNVNPIGVRSCYDEGKRCAETLCMDYHRQAGVVVKIIRIFNTYGPRMAQNDGRVVSNFIVNALQGKDIEIYGDGTQTRSFQYVDDLIDGMIRMMATEDEFSGPVNLGNPGEFTMLELANLVLELTGSKSRIVFGTLPEDDPRKRRPDITLAQTKLSWQPMIPLRDGLLKTIDYFKSQL